MTPPALPPEAMEAGWRASSYCLLVFPGDESSPTPAEERAEVLKVLTAALPHLRRAILAEVVPQIVEMARAWLQDERRTYWQHDPASILAALEKGE